MDNRKSSQWIWGTGIALILFFCAPLVGAYVLELLEPIVVWVFLALLAMFALSTQALFEKSEDVFTRIMFFLISVGLLASFWYFVIKPD